MAFFELKAFIQIIYVIYSWELFSIVFGHILYQSTIDDFDKGASAPIKYIFHHIAKNCECGICNSE